METNYSEGITYPFILKAIRTTKTQEFFITEEVVYTAAQESAFRGKYRQGYRIEIHPLNDIKKKIDEILPSVFVFLSKKKLDDIFSWQDIIAAVQVSEDIEEVLKIRLYKDGYIKKHWQQAEDIEFILVTEKFKLFYSGLEEKKKQNSTIQHIHVGRDMIGSGNIQNSMFNQQSDSSSEE